TALGLALMTTLERDTSYVWPGIFMFIVGIGSGMFNSPHTAAMMGTVAPHRRGIAAGARVLVQNTGAVLSIAFVLAIVTSAVPKQVLFSVFSGLATHISTAQLSPFISNMHTALWCLCAVSLVGAVISAARPKDVTVPAAARPLRIGEVAELTGTTARTIRYYEEIGLLDSAPERTQGKHRVYTQADVDRVREIIRLRDLLGLSLEQLSQLLEAESARAHLRDELANTEDPAERKRILEELGTHIASQLELVK